jgi:CRP-like cAMP-binding protein
MPRDWLKPPKKRKETLSELIAAKDYPGAIEVLRVQLARRPGIQTRLQFADLLLLAGRQEEAMPILLGLADELTADGFVAKAVAILKRIDRLQPGRADIESRLGQLARQPSRAPSTIVSASPPARRSQTIGMEEIDLHAPAIAEAQAGDSAVDEPKAEAAAIEAPAVAEPTTVESKIDVEVASADRPPDPTPSATPERETTTTPGAAAPTDGLPVEAISSDTPAPDPPFADMTPVPDTTPVPEPAASASAAALEEAPREPAGFGALWKRLFNRVKSDGEEAPAVTMAAAPADEAKPAADAPAEVLAPDLAEAAPEATVDAPPEASLLEASPEVAAETPAEASAEKVLDPAPPAVPTAEERAALELPPAAPTIAVEVPSDVRAAATAAVDPAVDPAVEPAEPAPLAAEPTDPESPAVVKKFGGVFKRFLESLPGGDVEENDDSDRVTRDFAETLEAAGLDGDEDDDTIFQAFIDDETDTPPVNDAALSNVAALEPLVSTNEAEPVSSSTELDAPREAAAPAGPQWTSPMSEAGFRDQVLDLIEEVLKRPPEPDPAEAGETTEPIASAYRDELLAHPLFSDLSEDAMLAMLRALRFVCFEPGEVIVSEGEPGASLFLVISGDVKLFVRNPVGHNVPVGKLTEGSFFGEMSLLSGRPRNATLTAAGRVDLLELPKVLLDGIAEIHPRVRDTVDALYVQRASSAEVSAVRNITTGDAETRARAMQVLTAYFGGRRWEPRMQLKLAMVLLKAGKEEEAVPVLVDLADTLLREGEPAKAIGILKKVEMIRGRSLRVMNLAPLARVAVEPLPGASPTGRPLAPTPAWLGRTQGFFEDWLGTFRRSMSSLAAAAAPRRIPGYGPELVASPLFEGFSEEELLAFMQGLRLGVFEPGDVILTEGEPGESVFILTTGTVKVFVRNPAGHDIQLCELREGAFFGEMSTLSGRPRTATVTAASRCELLEMDRPTLEGMTNIHPRIRQVLEEVYIERASSAQAARIRTAAHDQTEA